MDDVGITRLINGPEAFTPDGEFCLGETEVRGLFVAAGFCAHGLAGAGGIGKAMAEWIVGGEPRAWTCGRWTSGASARSTARRPTRSARARGLRDLLRHQVPAPRAPGGAAAARARRPTTGTASTAPRSARSPAGSASTGTTPTRPPGDESLRPRGWAGMHWSPAIGAEHAACREAAALFDETSFAKLEVSGPGAAELLERLCDNRRRARRRPDHLHADAQLARRDRVRLHGRAAGRGPLRHRHRHRVRPPRPRLDPPLTPGDGVRVEDVTSRWACAGLWGPRARDVLAAACTDDLSFPYMSWRELTVGDVPVRALRVTYVGELGWELYCPMEYGGALWRTLWEAGAAARARRRRLPGDRLAAAREGLPRLGRRHHAGRDAVRGRPRLLRAVATRRSSAATRSTRRRRGACAASCSPTRGRWRSPTSRCAWATRSPAA